jgi:hypothetical protein
MATAIVKMIIGAIIGEQINEDIVSFSPDALIYHHNEYNANSKIISRNNNTNRSSHSIPDKDYNSHNHKYNKRQRKSSSTNKEAQEQRTPP